MIKYALCIISCVILAFSANASEKIYRNKLNTCTPTKTTINDYEPEKFQPSNNLLHSAGAVPMFCGQEIILKGKVVDIDCVPVADAKVYLWQVGCDGKYPYKPLRTRINHSEISLHPVSSFQGSGTATTDNNGNFQFITIYPPHIHHSAPHINLRIEHMHIGTIQTSIFPQEPQNDIDEGNVYNFTIVMHEKNKHRRY